MRASSSPGSARFSWLGALLRDGSHVQKTRERANQIDKNLQAYGPPALTGVTVGGSFGGRTIEYRGDGLPDGPINIGTYYPVP